MMHFEQASFSARNFEFYQKNGKITKQARIPKTVFATAKVF